MKLARFRGEYLIRPQAAVVGLVVVALQAAVERVVTEPRVVALMIRLPILDLTPTLILCRLLTFLTTLLPDRIFRCSRLEQLQPPAEGSAIYEGGASTTPSA